MTKNIQSKQAVREEEREREERNLKHEKKVFPLSLMHSDARRGWNQLGSAERSSKQHSVKYLKAERGGREVFGGGSAKRLQQET